MGIIFKYIESVPRDVYIEERITDINSWTEEIDNFKVISVIGEKKDEKWLYSQQEILKILKESHLSPINGILYKVQYNQNGNLELIKSEYSLDYYTSVSIPYHLNTPEVKNKVLSIILSCLIVYIAVLTLILVAWAGILRLKIILPLKEIQNGFTEMLSGNKSQIFYKGNSELESIVDSFNITSNRLFDLEESKERLIRNISHDLKTPLTSILVTIRALEDGILTPDHITYRKIINQINNLNTLIERFLDYNLLKNGNQKLESQVVEFNFLLNDYRKINDPQDINWKLKSSGFVKCRLDRDLIFRVLDNIIGNGRKHNVKTVAFTITSTVSDGYIKLSITNDGSAIPNDIESKIFDPLVTGEDSRNNSANKGLGLSIVMEIMNLHGGYIELFKNIEGYVEFILTFPIFKS